MTRTLPDLIPRLEPASDTRSRLVASAMQLVHAQSYHSVGVKAICDLAAVQRGSFYHFFESKQALMLEGLDVVWNRYEQGPLAACRDASIPPRTRIEAVVDDLYARHQRDRHETGQVLGCVFGNLAAESAAIDEAIRIRLDRIFADWTAILAIPIADAQTGGELTDARTPLSIAGELIADLQGLMLLAKVRNDPDVIWDGARSITERLWNGNGLAPR